MTIGLSGGNLLKTSVIPGTIWNKKKQNSLWFESRVQGIQKIDPSH